MAIANYFYNQTTRKYVALFGTLFNQLKIKRTTNDGTVSQDIIVPLSYAPFQKVLARVQQDANLLNSRRAAIQLPRMSFEITNMFYDPARKISTTRKVYTTTAEDNEDNRNILYSPVPYNLDFSLYIMTKYSEDATKLLEQIIPFFTPDWTVTARMMDDIDPIDIPVVLNGITVEELYEGDFETRQSVLHTLSFTLKGWYFGPIKEKKVIKFVEANLSSDTATNAAFQEQVQVYPGLSPDGNPVTQPVATASAIASIANGGVSSVSVVSDGEGYDANNVPGVTITPPSIVTATAAATVVNELITSIDLTNAGGYYSTVPNVSISNPDGPAQLPAATANVIAGVVDSITLTEGGRYYSLPPTVTIAPPPSIAPVFKFGDDALFHSGNPNTTTILGNPSADIDTGPDDGYALELWFYPFNAIGNRVILWSDRWKLWYNSSAVIYSLGPNNISLNESLNLNQWNHIRIEHVNVSARITVNGNVSNLQSPGGGAVNRTYQVIRAGADPVPSSSIAQTNVNDSFYGAIDNVTFNAITEITANTTIPTVASTGSFAEYNFDKDIATANATVTDGEVIAINLINGGSNYNSAPAISFSAATGNPSDYSASATATINNGLVDSIIVTDPGKFYVDPVITIDPPTSNTATATAAVDVNGNISSITITNAGKGYLTVPSVTVDAPANNTIWYQDIEEDDDWGVISVVVDYEE